jgi:hypothetical protein
MTRARAPERSIRVHSALPFPQPSHALTAILGRGGDPSRDFMLIFVSFKNSTRARDLPGRHADLVSRPHPCRFPGNKGTRRARQGTTEDSWPALQTIRHFGCLRRCVENARSTSPRQMAWITAAMRGQEGCAPFRGAKGPKVRALPSAGRGDYAHGRLCTPIRKPSDRFLITGQGREDESLACP